MALLHPPAAASSSSEDEEVEKQVEDDEEVEKQVEKRQKKRRSAMKKPKSERKKKKKQKKVKVDVDEGEQHKEETEKKKKSMSLIQRLWSDEDELVILKEMIENKKNGGIDPMSNLKEFIESIKKSLQVKEVKQEQLKNKIQRLKKKFMNNSKRAKGDEDPIFSNPHEKLSYTLMKEIWGSGGNSGVVADVDDDDDDYVVVTNVKRSSSSRLRKSQNAVGNPVRTKWEGISTMGLDEINEDENGAEKGDLEQKWRRLIADELKLYLRRIELVREQTLASINADGVNTI